MNLSIYSREEKRKRFQSASSWRESTGSAESMSGRTGKEKGWTARALQFLGNRRPISARAKSTPVRRQWSATASPPSVTVTPSSSRTTAETDVARDRAILHSLPLPTLAVASFCTRAESHSLVLFFSHARSINRPPAMWRDEGFVYTQPGGEKPPAI